jgi:hypothetical protein
MYTICSSGALSQSCSSSSSAEASPICLIQDDDFVPAWRQRHLFLRKHLDLVAHHVYAPAAATAEPPVHTGAAHAHSLM